MMNGLKATAADLKRYRRRFEALFGGKAPGFAVSPGTARPIRDWPDFGPNPGNLRMLTYKPAGAARNPPLVVVLHGCTQTAAAFAESAGWLALADRHGFGVLMPEQLRANNPNLCFNWFLPQHTQRGAGEAASINAMVDCAAATEGFDRQRVFIAGLSAGGAMAAAMLATYPETFAAGAVVAGVPYGAAGNIQEAFHAMFHVKRQAAAKWGALVRGASDHAGPYSRIAIWHGTADQTVLSGNADELVKQWTDVHGLTDEPSESGADGRISHRVWRDAAGRAAVEEILVEGMAHGVPVDPALADGEGGAAGPFLLDVGIGASLRIAQSWGLAPLDTEVASATGLSDAQRSAPEQLRPAQMPNAAPPKAGAEAIIRAALRKAGLIAG